MHEGPIARSILDTAISSAPGGSRIKKIIVACGPLSGIEKESLELYFSELAKGTPAEGAALDLKKSEAVLLCSSCGNREVMVNGSRVKEECSKCGGPNRLECDEGVSVESIIVE